MKIAIIEDDVLVGDLIARVCQKEIGAEVVVQEKRGDPGLRAVLEARPNLVISDLALPDRDGLEVLTSVLEKLSGCYAVALTALEDPLTMLRVRQLGLHGLAHKKELTVSMLREAITTVLAGKTYYSSIMAQVLAKHRSDPRAFNLILSNQEQELLVYIANCCSDSEIAAYVGLQPYTIQSRRRDIMRKLDIHSTPKLIEYSGKMGFARLGLYLPQKLRVRWP